MTVTNDEYAIVKLVEKSRAVLVDDEALFEILRALRMEIAKARKVPPHIDFSDKTLIHMCVVKPRTKMEMLSVSGVGEFKYEKYGERFLDCVKEECGDFIGQINDLRGH